MRNHYATFRVFENTTKAALIVFGITMMFNITAVAQPRVINPFEGAVGYVDPDYSRQVNTSRDLSDASYHDAMFIVARQPTAIWLDSLSAIDRPDGQRLSLEEHLVNAVSQQAGQQRPMTLSIVLYSLPNRDCAAHSSNGTLNGEAGLRQYKEQYVDRIAALLGDERFSSLRIVLLIEPDSLPNLVTNQSVPGCKEAFESEIYAEGIAYALTRFSGIGNVYSYLDFGHSGWLGWHSNRARAVELYTDVVRSSGALSNISGVVTNVSGYTPVEEFLLPDSSYAIGNHQAKAARFYEYNSQFDERDFAIALHEDFLAAGFPPGFGVLIDTSRNGWGGVYRPEVAAWRSSVNAFVDAARLDRRPHRGNWCNQDSAGIGDLPRANPYEDGVIHSFVWVKPPGESDGTSDSSQTTPDNEGKSFDASCDPNHVSDLGIPTGALPNAPASGAWFHEQFEMLVRNAYPPLM